MISYMIYFIVSTITYTIFVPITRIGNKNNHSQVQEYPTTTKRLYHGLIRAFVHVIVLASIIYTLLHVAKQFVDQTGWAVDIKRQNVYGSIVSYEKEYDKVANKIDTLRYNHQDKHNHQQRLLPINTMQKIVRPTTFPTKYDVLMETKYGSRHLGSFRMFMDYHPGNQIFLQYMKHNKSYYESKNTGEETLTSFQLDVAHYIVDKIMSEHNGRFLQQLPDGTWSRISYEEALSYTIKELSLYTTDIRLIVRDEIRYIMHDTKFGIHRKSALIMDHSVPYIMSFEKRILPTPIMLSKIEKHKLPTPMPYYPTSLLDDSFKEIQKSDFGLYKLEQRRTIFTEKRKPAEPYIGAWLEEDTIAETLIDDSWYVGYITHVSPKGKYKIDYPDGDKGEVDFYSIRPFVPFQKGEPIEVSFGQEYEPCTYVKRTPDGQYEAIVDETSEHIIFSIKDVARPGGRIRKKPDRDAIEGMKFKYVTDS
jgi:hypothetical protein